MKQFEKNKFLDKAFDALCVYTADYERGQFLPYADIERVTGVLRTSNTWGTMIAKWKRHVQRERGITISTERGEGYQYPSATDQVNGLARARIQYGLNDLVRAIRILDGPKADELTEFDNNNRAASKGSVSNGIRNLRHDQREIDKDAKVKNEHDRIEKRHRVGR